MKQFSLIVFGVFLLPVLAMAATDEFTMRVLVGDDTTPPTTPTILSVVPVASNQIDVTWSASVDNFLLGGYVLLRDGVPISTTTLTTYIDTGLVAETTYSYSVYAFDSAGNVSTTSAPLATTTLALPPPVATTTPAEGGRSDSTITVLLRDFSLVPSTNSAELKWETSRPTRYALRWGRTDAFTGGYIVSEAYQAIQKTTIFDLEPGTVYQYELIGYSPAGFEVVLKRGQFTTLDQVNQSVVPNVVRLAAEVAGSDVRLSWQLPKTDTPVRVRVVRNHFGYPSDMYDGALVYDGTGSEVVDVGALSQYSPQYYTVFTIGPDGTVSSGAVVVTTRARDDGEAATSTPSVPVPIAPPLPLFGLDANAITITQAGEVFTFLSDEIRLLMSEPFTLSLPYEAVPKYLKSIIVTLLDPTDQRRSYSFLLRINKAGTAYETTIAPLGVAGVSRMQIEIFDFERQIVGRYQKQITFAAPSVVLLPVLFPDALVGPMREALPGFLGLLALGVFGLFFFWWRRHKTEDNQ